MNKMKFVISLILAVSILMAQVAGAFAAPVSQDSPSIKGAVQSITLETDSNTAVTTIIVTVVDSNQILQTARVSERIAKELGLVMFDGDGKLVINDSALGQPIDINPTVVIPAQEADRHPVGNALATFFSDIAGLDYNAIMTAHNEGIGFGVIAQALWLTVRLEGNAQVFQALLRAKKTGDYTAFTLDDGATPKNWGQLRKAVLDGKKIDNLGSVMSNNDNGNNTDSNKDKNKDKEKDKDKDKNKDNGGNGNGNNDEKNKDKKK